MMGGRDPHIRDEQHRFQFVVEFVVQLAPGAEETGEPRAELLPRLGKALFQAVEPAAVATLVAAVEET